MRFRVLGPVEADAENIGERTPLSAAKLRSLLAVLLLHANQQVSRDQLMTAVWPSGRPRSADAVLRTYVSGLRRTLGFSRGDQLPRLAVAPAGYRLDVAPADLDVLVFEELVARGRQALGRGEPGQAVGLLCDALALWRGYPAQDASVDPDTEVALARLVELRLSAEEAWAEAELAQRHEAEVVPRLRALVGEYPLREQFWVQLMTALHRTGRRAEALTAFRELRRSLVDELGLEPGLQARELQSRILAEPVPVPRATGRPPGPARLTTANGPPPSGTGLPGPRLLPAVIPGFTGRGAELSELDRVLARAVAPGRTAPGLVVLAGPPGVGKSALAVCWAHAVADQFPDGQLYADLLGFSPHGRPVSTEAVVRRFLEALQVPPDRVPGDPAAQADLYRSLLARRRVLAVLDNAADAEQVRALLPTTPGSMTVVTSRDYLIGLLARAGAEPLALDVLAPADARELLNVRLGARRLAGDPEAAADVVRRCGGLPLALTLVAARLAAHPGFTLEAVAADLGEGGVLDSLDHADPGTGPRAVFSWSCQRLTMAALRLFGLIGLHPGPDVSSPAAGALDGTAPGTVRTLLAELGRGGLIEEHAPGRYTLHDLLRAYAAERARAELSGTDRRSATHRMLDYYLHTAHAAALALSPMRPALALSPPALGAVATSLTGRAQALAWLRAERQVLLRAVDLAAAEGFDAHAWQLGWCLVVFLHREGHWQDLLATQQTAAAAASRLGDPAAQALSEPGLARALALTGSGEKAVERLRRALALFRELGDVRQQAAIHLDLGQVAESQGQYRDALGHCEHALPLFRAAQDRTGEARALNNLGWFRGALGDHERAADYCGQAVRLYGELGAWEEQAAAWDSLGRARHHLGQYPAALDCLQRAIDLHLAYGDRAARAAALAHAGDTHLAAGNPAAAGTAWRQALSLLDDLGHPDAAQVRARLHHFRPAGGPAGPPVRDAHG